MKTRHLLTALLLVFSFLYAREGRTQGAIALEIVDMPGFPDLPQDTAYENQTYAFDIELVNSTNDTINSAISFYLRVDTLDTVFFTNPQTFMAPGDTLTLGVPFYNFTQPLFKLGNNIVVVWPVVNGMTVPVDSFHTVVHFIPLTSLGGTDHPGPAFRLYPVPSRNFIQLDFEPVIYPEHVRILTLSGQLVKDVHPAGWQHIDISLLSAGIYLLEVKSAEAITRRKFQKY